MIDSTRLAALHEKGLSQAEIARQLGCSRSSVKRNLTKASPRLTAPENGTKAPVTSEPATATDALNRGNGNSADLEAVAQALDEHWQRLSLVERMRFFLKA